MKVVYIVNLIYKQGDEYYASPSVFESEKDARRYLKEKKGGADNYVCSQGIYIRKIRPKGTKSNY